jgi:hypothetical protein
MSVTSVGTFQKDSLEVKIFDMAIGAVIVHVLEDKQTVAHKTMDKPETKDDFVGMV